MRGGLVVPLLDCVRTQRTPPPAPTAGPLDDSTATGVPASSVAGPSNDIDVANIDLDASERPSVAEAVPEQHGDEPRPGTPANQANAAPGTPTSPGAILRRHPSLTKARLACSFFTSSILHTVPPAALPAVSKLLPALVKLQGLRERELAEVAQAARKAAVVLARLPVGDEAAYTSSLASCAALASSAGRGVIVFCFGRLICLAWSHPLAGGGAGALVTAEAAMLGLKDPRPEVQDFAAHCLARVVRLLPAGRHAGLREELLGAARKCGGKGRKRARGESLLWSAVVFIRPVRHTCCRLSAGLPRQVPRDEYTRRTHAIRPTEYTHHGICTPRVYSSGIMRLYQTVVCLGRRGSGGEG